LTVFRWPLMADEWNPAIALGQGPEVVGPPAKSTGRVRNIVRDSS
jgi:hypothetical protein